VGALDTEKIGLEALMEEATLSSAEHTEAAGKMTTQIFHLEEMVSHACRFFMLLAGRTRVKILYLKKRVICAVLCSRR
jgi:hypothetical protein